MLWRLNQNLKTMKSNGNFHNITIGKMGGSRRHFKNVIQQLLCSVGDIEERVRVAGNVYVVSVDSDHTPLIMFEKSEGAGIFNPKKLIGGTDRLWFILSHPHTRMVHMTVDGCSYCGKDNCPTLPLTVDPNNLLMSSLLKNDDGELVEHNFSHNPDMMCTECLESLLGVVDACEEQIKHNITSLWL